MTLPSATSIGQCYVDGEWTDGLGAHWQRRSPADEQPVWQGQWATAVQTEQAIGAAQHAFASWSETMLEERISLCKGFSHIVSERREELATLVAIETGKPLWEARTEVSAVVAKVANSIDAILKRRWTTTEPSGDFLAVTRYRPHGVMLVLGPFNLPAHLPGAHIVPALLAGNTVVFKPSELAPATGQWLVQAWRQAGLPAGVLQLVHGAADVAIAAAQHASTAGVLFTGSRRVGVSLHNLLAGQPEKVLALEMGGNNPLVIHGTDNLRAAAITTIFSAFITSGQRCTCARRLIVSGTATYQRLVEQLHEWIPKIVVGLPLDEAQPFMGPLIHVQAADNMLEAQRKTVAAGGELLIEMQRSSRSRALLTPGLIAAAQMKSIEDCEHFGPLLIVELAEDLDDAIRLANNTRFGLSAGFIGDRVEDFHYFLHHVRAGVINWNRQTTGASGKLPFGGVGLSGNHQPSGYFAADYCSYPVASLESHTLSDTSGEVPGLNFDVH
ncbi:MAG: succinylglutamate-semialdehyde dehydrogenase [Pirellulaceae bacterium]|nr:succinylglutamate-semialdehyde dehydrogenase [Pirellulaceae bacterium]